MIDAEIAITHLNAVWQAILSEISESREQFGTINNALKLSLFKIRFKKVIEPWKSVGGYAENLSRIIDAALNEYKKQYKTYYSSKEPINMTSIFTLPRSDLSYPKIEITSLKQAIKNISHLVQFQSQGLRVIQGKAASVNAYAQSLDKELRLIVPKLYTFLKNLQLQEYFNSIAEIDDTIAKTSLSGKDLAGLQIDRAEIIAELEDSVGKGVIKFRESASIVDTKMLNLSKVVIAEHLEQSYKNERKRQ